MGFEICLKRRVSGGGLGFVRLSVLILSDDIWQNVIQKKVGRTHEDSPSPHSFVFDRLAIWGMTESVCRVTNAEYG